MKNLMKRVCILTMGLAISLSGPSLIVSHAAPAYGPSVYGPGDGSGNLTSAAKPGPSVSGPAVTDNQNLSLGGAKLTLLANQSASQMLSAVLETRNGSLIVIDGGTPEDADHLLAAIRAKGSRVSTWLVTHPHSDHIGALTTILEQGADITIDHVYYNMTSIEWYQQNESYRADTVAQFAGALNRLPADRLHGTVKRGDIITVDEVTIKPLNSPYLFSNNAINNSSVAYALEVNGVNLVFLGDMGTEAGDQLMRDYAGQTIPCDILQMAHHGQHGVTEEVYKKLKPRVCLWPTPDWLWDNNNGGGYNSGPWMTLETRAWMDRLGVVANYCIKDGDQVIQ